MDEKLAPPKTFVAMAIITFQYGAYFGLKMRYSPICACAQRSPLFIYKQFI